MAAQFSYFTTSDDLREIVKQVDANTQFQYIEYKNFPESEYPNARMYVEYPHLGYARSAQCRGDMMPPQSSKLLHNKQLCSYANLWRF